VVGCVVGTWEVGCWVYGELYNDMGNITTGMPCRKRWKPTFIWYTTKLELYHVSIPPFTWKVANWASVSEKIALSWQPSLLSSSSSFFPVSWIYQDFQSFAYTASYRKKPNTFQAISRFPLKLTSYVTTPNVSWYEILHHMHNAKESLWILGIFVRKSNVKI